MSASNNTFLPVPFKRTDKLSYEAPLRKHIQQNYKEDPALYTSDLAQLDALRDDNANNCTVENSLRYLVQLGNIQYKFPISEKTIKILFTWTEAFAQKKKVTAVSVNYERACVLFNLGAFYSQQAAKVNLGNAEGLKQACAALQSAAGIFNKLNQFVTEFLPLPPSSDLSAALAKSLELLMLAQAQECVYLRTVLDKKSDAMIAKLAVQTGDLYDQAFDAAMIEQEKNKSNAVLPNEWLGRIQAKALIHHTHAHIRQGTVDLAAGQYGAEIARLQAARSWAAKAMEIDKGNMVGSEAKGIVGFLDDRLAKANKDNDLIYHEPVPKFNALPPLARILMVKPSPMPQVSSEDVRPLFASLVPLNVLKVANEYNHQKTALVQSEIARLEESNANMQKALMAMNLPAAIEALEQPIGLPQGVIERAAEVRGEGGARSIVDMMETITNMNKSSHSTLTECSKLLDEEEASYKQYVSQFGSRWSVAPSTKLNDKLRLEIQQKSGQLTAAEKLDVFLRDKIDKHRAGIEALSGSQTDLENSIPSSRIDTTPVRRKEAMNAVKHCLEQNKLLKLANEELVQQIRDFSMRDDIVGELLELEASGKSLNDDNAPLFKQRQVQYEPYTQKVSEQVRKQEDLLQQIKINNDQFVAAKESATIISERETALRNLDVAYNAFNEIRSHMREALKFYTDLDHALRVLYGKCQDYVFARSTEARELAGDIQRQAAGFSSPPSNQGPPPMNMSYQAPRYDPMTGQPLYLQQGGFPPAQQSYGRYGGGNPYQGYY